ncbi:MAG: hypothetical protein ACP5P4_08385 [Steroidobacteraceae bacterium]
MTTSSSGIALRADQAARNLSYGLGAERHDSLGGSSSTFLGPDPGAQSLWRLSVSVAREEDA